MPHLVNLTPHIVSIQGKDLEGNNITLSIPPSGDLARIETYDRGLVGTIENITINHGINNDKKPMPGIIIEVKATQYKKLILPHPKKDTIYITSMIVAKYAADRGRIDVLFPGPHVNGKELRQGLIKPI